MTLSAVGVYALRCGVLASAFLTIGIRTSRAHVSAAVAFPALLGLGIVIGLFAFYGDYRARIGRRTTLGPVTRAGLVTFGVLVGLVALLTAGSNLIDALVAGRPATLGALSNVPFVVLFLLSFTDRLAPWPWSEPTGPIR